MITPEAIKNSIGSNTDTALTSDTNGSAVGFLRGLVKMLASVWDSTNNRLHVATTTDPPLAANILNGCLSATGTLITIPANRTWAGWISLNAGLSIAASGAAVSSRAGVSTVGSTVTPAAGVLLGVSLSVPAQLSTTTIAITGSDRNFFVISAGTSSATVTLAPNSVSVVSATASGVLIA